MQMVLVFLDSQGLVYMHIVPQGVTINANHTSVALGKFLKISRRRTLRWSSRSGSSTVITHLCILPLLSRTGWPRMIQVLQHPAYLPDLVPADFFLFRKVK
jgi:hypothetical protein